jgi:biopolymer transport protein ExbD
MIGQRRGRRATRRTIVVRPVKDMEAAINVTPLIDVVLVLLIIFMVMTPLVERDLAVQLSSEKHTEQASEVAPDQVVVALDAAGALQINAQPVASGEYVSKLRSLLDGRSADDQVVFVVAGDDTSYADLVQAIDRAKLAGATTVGLATDIAP